MKPSLKQPQRASRFAAHLQPWKPPEISRITRGECSAGYTTCLTGDPAEPFRSLRSPLAAGFVIAFASESGGAVRQLEFAGQATVARGSKPDAIRYYFSRRCKSIPSGRGLVYVGTLLYDKTGFDVLPPSKVVELDPADRLVFWPLRLRNRLSSRADEPEKGHELGSAQVPAIAKVADYHLALCSFAAVNLIARQPAFGRVRPGADTRSGKDRTRLAYGSRCFPTRLIPRKTLSLRLPAASARFSPRTSSRRRYRPFNRR